jgi:hypothetical protein
MKKASIRKTSGLGLGLFLGLLLSSASVFAAPVSIDIGDFSGNENIIDFNSIADEEQIVDQFADQCVTFSGAIYGMTNSGDINQFPNSGGVIASNWLYDGSGLQGTSFTADFGGPYTKAGFFVETNTGDNTTIEVVLNSSSGGSLTFATNTDGSEFIGVEDTDGFDSITVSVAGASNQFLAIDDLRFEGGELCGVVAPEISTVPVPSLSISGLITLVLGLFALGLFGLRARVR